MRSSFMDSRRIANRAAKGKRDSRGFPGRGRGQKISAPNEKNLARRFFYFARKKFHLARRFFQHARGTEKGVLSPKTRVSGLDGGVQRGILTLNRV
jgi:hypothetical protein